MIIINLILGLLFVWLFLKALGWLLKWFVLYKINNLTKGAFSQNRHNRPSYEADSYPESLGQQRLVQCAQCSIYIVKGHALERGNKYFCSKAHLPR